MKALINKARELPVNEGTPFVSASPVTVPSPGRPVDLEVRVSAPVTGSDLPVLLLSHGHGGSNYLASLHGCTPLADFWAAHGFVVIQPTHLNSKTVDVDRNGPEGPLFWRSRVEDMHRILDRLDLVEDAVPGLGGRVDRDRVAVAGYSIGGHTAAMLLGMRLTDPTDGSVVDLSDSRVKTGVLLAAPGNGADLTPTAAERFSFLRNVNFTEMTAPALVVAGDKDVNPAFTDRTDWRADPYFLSPGPKSLLTVFGGEHGLGGVSGYDAAETTDEDPERLAAVQRLTWAYLRSELYPEDPAWASAQSALAALSEPMGSIESK